MKNNNEISQADIEALAGIEIFLNVDVSQLQSLLGALRKIELSSDENLLTPDQPNQEIFLLLQGELIICLQPDDFQSIARIKAGDCVGELSLIDDRPPSAFVKAVGDCRLLAIHRDAVGAMFERQPHLAVNLLRLLSRRFRQNNDVLADSFRLQREYRDKAERDALTGLHNRRWMSEVFPSQLQLSERIGQQVTLLMIDVDFFKKVNDEYGHRAGDLALQQLGGMIADNLRDTDLLVRYGGEELVVLMPGTGAAKAQAVADRVRRVVMETPVQLEDGKRSLSLTVSIGLSQWRQGESIDCLINRSDKALYQSKERGRNLISVQ